MLWGEAVVNLSEHLSSLLTLGQARLCSRQLPSAVLTACSIADTAFRRPQVGPGAAADSGRRRATPVPGRPGRLAAPAAARRPRPRRRGRLQHLQDLPRQEAGAGDGVGGDGGGGGCRGGGGGGRQSAGQQSRAR